jgi:hypothetical protein
MISGKKVFFSVMTLLCHALLELYQPSKIHINFLSLVVVVVVATVFIVTFVIEEVTFTIEISMLG